VCFGGGLWFENIKKYMFNFKAIHAFVFNVICKFVKIFNFN